MNLKIRYILSVYLIFILAACDSTTYDDQNPTNGSTKAEKVYLSVSHVQADNTETINEDTKYYEDRVRDLALLVFDSSTGKRVCRHFDEGISFDKKEKSFTVTLTPGERDFYFIANMPMTELENISTKAEMEKYMGAFRDLDPELYLAAKQDKAFPMSRVYLKQNVTEGGSILQPVPFRPDGENRVKLIRGVAKLEVVIDGTSTSSGVKNIYYKNAFRAFSLLPESAYSLTAGYYDDKPLQKVGNSYVYYMPEAMMISPNWSAANHKPVNYFQVETFDGTFYNIPIITDDRTITETDYMTFATGQKIGDYPDYNIYRNRHYYYRIKKLQTIEVVYTIDPWIINKNETFMGYGYNVNIGEDGKVTVSNTVEVCAPHSVILKTVSPFSFEDGTTEKIFDTLTPDASVEYTLKPVPKLGDSDYLKVYYNVTEISDPAVKTFSK